MSLQDAFERGIPSFWKMPKREPHYRGDVPYKSAPSEQPPRRQGKFAVKAPSAGTTRARILALLAANPDGMTNIEIRGVLHIGKGPCGSMLCQMAETGEIVRDGQRKCGVKTSTVYKVGKNEA